LLLWIIPLTIAATIAGPASTYFIARSVIMRHLEEGIQSLSDTSSLQAKSFFEQRHNDLTTISHSPLFKDHYLNIEYGLSEEAEVYRREIENMLLDFARRAKVYPHISYVNAAGRELCRVMDQRIVAPEPAHTDSTLTLELKGLQPGKRRTSGIHRVAWHKAPIIRYTMGVFDPAGALRGAVLFDCSLAPIYDALGRLHMGRSTRSYLSARPALYAPRASPRQYGDLVIASAIVPATPWAIVTTVRRTEFLESLRWIGTATLLLCVGTALLLIFVITRQVRVLLAPLYVLADAARSYAAGDLRVRVRIGHPEETAALAESFNSMADSLEHRTQDLERRVRELTSLQRMNEFIVHHGGLREVGRACLEAAVNGLGFDRGHLFWIETDKSRIVGECTYRKDAPSFDDGAILGQKISLESSDILAVTARNGTAIQVTDASKDQRCRDSALLEHWAPAFCLAPLAGRSGALGIVYVDHHLTGRPISDQQKRGLSLFCAEAGLAIENTQLWDAIVQSEARYRTAVENSPYAVVGLDQNLRITLWNRRAETLFGYQPTEAYGRTLAFLFEEQTYKLLARQVETTGSVRQAEITGQTRDGRRLDLTVSWSGQDAGPRSAREWFVVMEDETEKKRMRAQLLQAEKLSAVGNLIAGVAHELNNPLAAVTGFAELLRDLPLQTEEREDLRHLYHSALRCRDIVQGLLLFVRKEKTVRHKLSLNEITQATIALFEYRIVKTEGIDLEVSLDPQTPFVAGNFHSIQQILVNLISNSCDALKGRLGPRAIHLRTRRSPQNCELIVEDTGPGVPPELRDKIFDPFYTSKPVGTGTGLGLSVSRQLTAEHGGTLRYEEGAQGGAMFVLALPPCPEGIPAATPQLGLPPQIQGRRVLVVDDEPDLVVLMMRLLREDGCIAEAALEIEEARRKLGQGAFDLAIIDLDLGQARGTELLHAARRLDCAPDCIIVTGDVLNAPLAAEVDRLGAPLLAKPFLRTDFLRVVRASLGERDRRNSPRGA